MDEIFQNIIHTASILFSQFGIRSVSIDSVCKELQISKKTFYVYFPQKENLVESVLLYQQKETHEKFSKLLKNKNAIESLQVIIKELKRSVENDSQLMCDDLERYYPKISEKFHKIKREAIRIGFEQNLEQGIKEGFYRADLDVEMISHFHAIQLKNTIGEMSTAGKKYSKKRLVDFFIDLIVHLIANEKGLAYLTEQSRTVEDNNNK